MNSAKDMYSEIQKIGYEIGQINRNKNIITFRYWRLPEENYKLKDTLLFHNTENDFIHFTSLETLYSIINSGHIRLYNLVNMDDKFEMEYASQELLFKESTEKVKEVLYCLSMCSSKNILNNETKELLLWKLHGRDGNGIIIRLKIENNLNQWYYYHLSKIHYGINKFGSIKNFNATIDNEKLSNKICCFIKHPIYKFENEIRLIFDNINPVTLTNKNNEKIYPITYPDKLHKTNKISYFQLPLLNFYDKNSKIFIAPNLQGVDYEIPKIQITEIILGYRYSESDKKNIYNNINPKFADLNIRITDLKKHY